MTTFDCLTVICIIVTAFCGGVAFGVVGAILLFDSNKK